MKILKFFSPTCGPCKVLDKNLKESGLEYESIDITDESNEELIAKYNIVTIPTILGVDNNGNSVLRYRGVISANDLIKYFK
jgi:thiol-disulfide isomerase/thioredoxin